ncbi:endocuticle structural glycoprotein SgAbd-8-like [Anoplophora glabripennis]|uniref:endocuticle structural glycoprotein SgAbd-8-like n=1 Tax=Anoplophora glabripennis TaxID=217634 RepID=UPI000C783812|nr:endocuticle structural glycoprotein SgAbd-8-like [Anoplophora glabripennis]
MPESYDTENGISTQESGNLVVAGSGSAIAAAGSYQYTSPEGVPVQVSYLADTNGFQPSGNVLPTSPPIPPAIQRSLDYIAVHPSSPSVGTPFVRKYYK